MKFSFGPAVIDLPPSASVEAVIYGMEATHPDSIAGTSWRIHRGGYTLCAALTVHQRAVEMQEHLSNELRRSVSVEPVQYNDVSGFYHGNGLHHEWWLDASGFTVIFSINGCFSERDDPSALNALVDTVRTVRLAKRVT
ncbi:hypothetical protein [Glycocaulis sp.]|uniref:hypothetical protein n=1 Tax=Glycocaulis sp. TaxID=1969725 RepID=UPI003F726CA6